MSRHKVARAIRNAAARQAANAAGVVQLGIVVDDSPLRVELTESRTILEDDEITLTQWVKRYHATDEIDVGDTVVVMRKHTGGEIHWLLTDVLSEKTPT